MTRLCAVMRRRLIRMKATSRRMPLSAFSDALKAGRMCGRSTVATLAESHDRLILAQQLVDHANHVVDGVVVRGTVVVADHSMLVGDGELRAVQQRLDQR